nr:potassium-transporting ATPase subunit F [Clavibacter sp. VKM Ac-2872]
MREDARSRGVYSSSVPLPGTRVRPAAASLNGGSPSARPRVHRRRHRPVRPRRRRRPRSGEAVITSFADAAGLVAAVLGIASVVYLVYALVRPEKF